MSQRPGMPAAGQPPCRTGSLPALLHVRPHEVFGVLFEYVVDLVEDRVDILAEFLTAFLTGRRRAGLVVAVPAATLALHLFLRHSRLPRARALTRNTTEQRGRSAPNPTDQPRVSASTSSCAVCEVSSSSPTCARVPRNGSRVGMRTSDSRPRSKITESHDAAATSPG